MSNENLKLAWSLLLLRTRNPSYQQFFTNVQLKKKTMHLPAITEKKPVRCKLEGHKKT